MPKRQPECDPTRSFFSSVLFLGLQLPANMHACDSFRLFLRKKSKAIRLANCVQQRIAEFQYQLLFRCCWRWNSFENQFAFSSILQIVQGTDRY